MVKKRPNTLAKNSKTNGTKFSIFYFRWSLLIFITGLLVFVLLSMLLKTYNFLPTLLSTIIPLLILVIKIEFDELKHKNEQLYIGRNFLLAYAIEINDLQLEFRNSRIIDKISKIDMLDEHVYSLEDMRTHKEEIYRQIEMAQQMIKVIENRHGTHQNFKDVLKRMLKHSELVFTDEQYHNLNMIHYNYMWKFKYPTKEAKINLQRQKDNFDLYIDDTSGIGGEILKSSWPNFVKDIKSVEVQMDNEKFIQNQIKKLISTLEKYDPIGENKSKV
ncbi:hypothetical protein [Staphylococcus cohnii]|uniref:hypothetical protein n=1 Tax=Staphylococcus cohnii TaxID=29382 RepID=UPI003ACD4654